MNDKVKTKSKKGKNKGKRSKQELFNLLCKYHQGQRASEKHWGYLIRNNLCDPNPMEAIRNHRSEWAYADYNKID
jgi:hypothetical protein